MSTAPDASPPPAVPAAQMNFWGTFVAVALPVSTLIIAIATVFITYQISRISDLADGIKNVNNRVDQIYPLIAQSTSDLGYIKGSLEATTMKISNTAEKADQITKRLESVVSGQEAQSKIIQEVGTSLASLSAMLMSQQHQIEAIDNKLNSESKLFHKNSFETGTPALYPFLSSGTVFAPKNFDSFDPKMDGSASSDAIKVGNFITDSFTPGKLVIVDWSDKKAVANFFKSLEDSNIDFRKLLITTTDADVAREFNSILMKSGLATDK